jgi:predicted hydrocarbon binding protein
MFNEERDCSRFSWNDLGDLAEGRPNLGESMPVLYYRLVQYTIRDMLITEFDVETAAKIFRRAGRVAGEHFCRNLLDSNLGEDNFLAELQKFFKNMGIGILRAEKVDWENQSLMFTIAEDLDCSGLPLSDETICDFDEGFLAGIFSAYTGQAYDAREVNCWLSGGRVCRFMVTLK